MLLALAAAYPLDIDAAVDQLFDQVKEADDIEVVTEIYGEPIAIVEYSSSADPEKGVTLTISRAPTELFSALKVNRSRSARKSRKSEPFPEVPTLTNSTESSTPSTGWPMRTDSGQPETICPPRRQCPHTSFNFWPI